MIAMEMSRTEKRRFWSVEIDIWRDSGKSAAAYCREKGLNYATFLYHERKRRDEVRPRLVAISPVNKREKSEMCAIRIVIGARRVEIENGFDEETLVRVLTTLNRVG